MRSAAALALLLAAALAGCAAPGPPMPAGAREWVWGGSYRIDSLIEVPPGVTLRLLAGTRLAFAFADADGDGYGDSGLHVRGRIVASGAEGNPVVFTSAEAAPRPGDWAGLLLDNSRGNLFEHCLFEYSRYAFHAHFSEGKITRSRLERNIEATRLGDSRFEISWSLIAGNVSKGLNFRACANHIHHNTVTANGTGVFLFETDSRSVVEENNIFGNEVYDLRLGDFYVGGMTLRGNWWGTADESSIRERVHEGDKPGDRGRVVIAPAAVPILTGWEAR